MTMITVNLQKFWANLYRAAHVVSIISETVTFVYPADLELFWKVVFVTIFVSPKYMIFKSLRTTGILL